MNNLVKFSCRDRRPGRGKLRGPWHGTKENEDEDEDEVGNSQVMTDNIRSEYIEKCFENIA